ncbi:PP2C-like domain-containing protein [Nymphon striatum]|nr:PP2C-like domain-containing protein [Nymphon striatum]
MQSGCPPLRYREVKREHPDILFGKSCQELPVHDISKLSKEMFAACTGPKGGLTRVNRGGRPIKTDDPEVSFIDDEELTKSRSQDINKNLEDVRSQNGINGVDNDQNSDKGDCYPSICHVFRERQNSCQLTFKKQGIRLLFFLNINGCYSLTENEDADEDVPRNSDCEIAGIKNWNLLHKCAYGKAITLYECHPITRENAGEPIADTFAMVARKNNAILALADGVNWGPKACLAARCAVHGCIDYLNKALFSNEVKMETTMDIFVCLLRSFHAAHNLILMENGMLTTLCAAFICQLKNRKEFVVCTCNVGDSLAYVYSQKYGVREITQGSHDIYSMRDMRDALGALGPVDGQNPELNNLTISMTLVEPGDIVFLTSDGISDNFDPVVGKFALPKKPDDTNRNSNHSTKVKSNSSTKGGTLERNKSSKRFKRLHCNTPNEDDIIPPMCLPIVEAYQRHELTLLRMEDLLKNGVTIGDKPCESAQNLCDQLIDFATKLTIAKRRILEDPDLYHNKQVQSECSTPTELKEITNNEQRNLRKKIGPKLSTVPGKLDHASCCCL